MKHLLFAIACTFIIDAAAPAFAQKSKTCSTICTGSGNSKYCTRTCY
jgi:hypothetical protein